MPIVPDTPTVDNSENFEPEFEPEPEENNGAFYFWGRNVIIAKNDDYGSTATINQDLIIRKDISFMPCEPFYKDFFHKEQSWGSSKKENKDSKKIKNREGVEIKITPEE
ncbi:15914_t:CDS:2, partial [Dentiscutata heterogama]